MIKTALILIDLQNDFLPGGALAVHEGDLVIPVANKLIEFARKQDWFVLATQDWHPVNHGSFAVNTPGAKIYDQGKLDGLPQVWWPVHCVQGSHGAKLAQELLIPDIIIQKGMHPNIDSYSGFFDNAHRAKTELNALLKKHHVQKLVVMGIATDYCVKFTVMDALSLGYEVIVVNDGCRGVDMPNGSSDEAYNEIEKRGAVLISSYEIINNLQL